MYRTFQAIRHLGLAHRTAIADEILGGLLHGANMTSPPLPLEPSPAHSDRSSQRSENAMLYYVTLGTNDLARARHFYEPTLATLGISALQNGKSESGYGMPGAVDPSLYVTTPFDNQPATNGNGSMIALTAQTRAAVQAFHTAALANGGRDEGAPGLRYSANFYSCYVRDPDGNKLSAVCTKAE